MRTSSPGIEPLLRELMVANLYWHRTDGATIGLFPIDSEALRYLRLTARPSARACSWSTCAREPVCQMRAAPA